MIAISISILSLFVAIATYVDSRRESVSQKRREIIQKRSFLSSQMFQVKCLVENMLQSSMSVEMQFRDLPDSDDKYKLIEAMIRRRDQIKEVIEDAESISKQCEEVSPRGDLDKQLEVLEELAGAFKAHLERTADTEQKISRDCREMVEIARGISEKCT